MKASTGLFASRDASSFLSLVRCSIRLNLRASLAWVFVSTISPPVRRQTTGAVVFVPPSTDLIGAEGAKMVVDVHGNQSHVG
jgi:hypothetical protein